MGKFAKRDRWNKMYDFGGKYAQTFKGRCNKCRKVLSVSTQKDDNPEYYTDVFIKCQCGGSALIVIPVN